MSSLASSNNVFINPKAVGQALPSHILRPSAEIRDFHTSLLDYSTTQLISLPKIAEQFGVGKVLIKDERYRYGLPSFKPLGIAWAIRNALIEELSETAPTPIPSTIPLSDLASKTKDAQIKLVTATDGKLGQIVAKLGKQFGVESINTRIFVESKLSEDVKEVIRREGAEVIEIEGDMEVVVREAWLHAVAVDGVFVGVDVEENYEDFPAWIVEGYSTIFNELDQQVDASPDFVVLPVGVGGLAQAAATHYKASSYQTSRQTRIMTVEPNDAAGLHASLKAGQRVVVKPGETILKHLNYESVSEAAWEVLQNSVDVSTVVEDEQVTGALAELKEHGIDVGSCGAAVVAALQSLRRDDVKETICLDANSVVVLIVTDSSED